jgi:hypothetical protein
MHGARTAKAATTAKLRTGQAQVISENPQQRRVTFAVKRHFFGVNGKADHQLLPSCSRSAANPSYFIEAGARGQCTTQCGEACQIHVEVLLTVPYIWLDAHAR